MAERARLVDAVTPQAPPPRSNGELVFNQPWEGRVFGLAVAAQQAGFFSAEEFRQALIAAIADDPDAPYYDRWSQALLAVILEKGLLDEVTVDRRINDFRDAGITEVH